MFNDVRSLLSLTCGVLMNLLLKGWLHRLRYNAQQVDHDWSRDGRKLWLKHVVPQQPHSPRSVAIR
jgi:hypothetical protein